jgi:hypothetical protein
MVILQHQLAGALVKANRELAARFEQELQSKLSEIWGD